MGGAPLAEVPEADLTVTMGPGIDGGDLQNPPMGELIRDSVEIVATFQTMGGQGHLARFQTIIEGQLSECTEVALPNSGGSGCGSEIPRFNVSLSSSQQDRGPLINGISIFGPPEVTAYEVDLGDFVVAIKPFNGAGYANWVGHGQPVTVSAHLENGDIESVPIPFFSP
jgi:hypothetical protein